MTNPRELFRFGYKSNFCDVHKNLIAPNSFASQSQCFFQVLKHVTNFSGKNNGVASTAKLYPSARGTIFSSVHLSYSGRKKDYNPVTRAIRLEIINFVRAAFGPLKCFYHLVIMANWRKLGKGIRQACMKGYMLEIIKNVDENIGIKSQESAFSYLFNEFQVWSSKTDKKMSSNLKQIINIMSYYKYYKKYTLWT